MYVFYDWQANEPVAREKPMSQWCLKWLKGRQAIGSGVVYMYVFNDWWADEPVARKYYIESSPVFCS